VDLFAASQDRFKERRDYIRFNGFIAFIVGSRVLFTGFRRFGRFGRLLETTKRLNP